MNSTSEFSSEFDILYDNMSSAQAPGLTEYEKSVVLTQAQDEIVLAYFSGKNSYNEGFEYTEEVRRYLSSLVTTSELSEVVANPPAVVLPVKRNKNSHFFEVPGEAWFITYEALKLNTTDTTCPQKYSIDVLPVTQDEFKRIVKNPFRGATKKRALRLDVSSKMVEIVYDIKEGDKYVVSFVKEPEPIILTTLTGTGKTIKGKSAIASCALHTALHRAILERAVQIAVSAYLRK